MSTCNKGTIATSNFVAFGLIFVCGSSALFANSILLKKKAVSSRQAQPFCETISKHLPRKLA